MDIPLYKTNIEWVACSSGRTYPALPIFVGPRASGLQFDGGWVTGLVDTGADHSVVGPGVLVDGIWSVSRYGSVHTASGIEPSVYCMVSIVFRDCPIIIDTECSIGRSDTFFGPFNFVIGRDILNKGTLVLDRGRSGSFSLDPSDFRL